MRITILLVIAVLFSCGSEKQEPASQKTDTDNQPYMQNGAEIATLTQAELLKNVSQAMKKGGPVYAIEFCNIRALYLKDSLSQKYNCQIRRVAAKYRNPIDMPQTDTEKEQLQRYQQAFDQGLPLEEQVHRFDDRVEYYKPIMLAKEACLKCHGQPGSDISDETMEAISRRYPMDKATGFALNDFRGAWKVTFMK